MRWIRLAPAVWPGRAEVPYRKSSERHQWDMRGARLRREDETVNRDVRLVTGD